jgi:4-carboxymuconolactone decarboxylase
MDRTFKLTGTAVIAAAAWMTATMLAGQAIVGMPGNRQPRPPSAARIAPLPEAEWSAEQRELAKAVADPAVRTLVRLPALVQAVAPYTTYLSTESTLAPRVRHLLILRTAWLCGSDVLWSRYASGLTPDERRRVAQGVSATGWSDADRALLRTADELFKLSSVSAATWSAISAAYDLHGLMDIVETVNHFTAMALLYNSIGIQVEGVQPGNNVRLPRDVAYAIATGPREPALQQARVTPLEGTGIAVGRTFARHERLNAARSPRANFINRVSALQPRHREMLILRTGWNTQSEYEWAQHVGSVGRARDYGLEPTRIAQGADAPGWDPFEQAILHAADELYRDAMVSDRTWKELAARFDATLLMSAVFTASSYRATAMALNAFGVQLEPGDERFPKLPGR